MDQVNLTLTGESRNILKMKTKHTPDKWNILIDDTNGITRYYLKSTMGGENGEEQEANARLIEEAGTVTNETGNTPRQLADKNKELLSTLRCARHFIKECGHKSEADACDKTIQNVTK